MAEIDRKVPAKMEIRQDFRYTHDDFRIRGAMLMNDANGVYSWNGPDGTFVAVDTRDTCDGEPVYRVISRSW